MSTNDSGAEKPTDGRTASNNLDAERVVKYASELTDPQGPLAGDETDVERVQDVARWLGDAAGVPRDVDADLEISADGHPDDTEWTKHAAVANGTIRSDGLVNYQYSKRGEDAEDLSARFELHAVHGPEVCLEATFDATLDRMEIAHGGVAELTPDQAEALAAALVEVAAEARQREEEDQ